VEMGELQLSCSTSSACRVAWDGLGCVELHSRSQGWYKIRRCDASQLQRVQGLRRSVLPCHAPCLQVTAPGDRRQQSLGLMAPLRTHPVVLVHMCQYRPAW